MVVHAGVNVKHEADKGADEHDDDPLKNVADVRAGKFFETEFDLNKRFDEDCHDIELKKIN